MSARYECLQLGKQHDRRLFDCGVPVLNDYLSRSASQDVKRNVSAVFVMVPTSDPNRIAGFYTLCATSIELAALPIEFAKQLPRYPHVPGILIGRLARDVEFPRLGSLLLASALTRCVRAAKEIAASVVVVDAKDSAAHAFYTRFNFLKLPKINSRLFLPIASAEKLFGS